MTATGTGTSLRLAMRLPRLAASVTTARHSLERALAGIGVTEECRDDLALALTEACGNAVEHAQIGHEYVVVVTVGRTRCIVEVIDAGVGMDVGRLNGHPVGQPGRPSKSLNFDQAKAVLTASESSSIHAYVDRCRRRRVAVIAEPSEPRHW